MLARFRESEGDAFQRVLGPRCETTRGRKHRLRRLVFGNTTEGSREARIRSLLACSTSIVLYAILTWYFRAILAEFWKQSFWKSLQREKEREFEGRRTWPLKYSSKNNYTEIYTCLEWNDEWESLSSLMSIFSIPIFSIPLILTLIVNLVA